MSVSGREALPDVREWSGCPSGCPGVVGKPSRMSRSGREWSGGPPKCPGVVGRPSRMSGSGLETLPYIREWSGSPP